MTNPMTKDTPDFEAVVVKQLYDIAELIGDTTKQHQEWYEQTKAAILAAHNQAVEAAVTDYITVVYGKRCETKDTTDFAELKGTDGRCITCEMWEDYDAYAAALQTPTNQKGGE